MGKERKRKVEDLVSNSIENISDFINVNTVLGDAVTVGKNLVIPLCKVTTCFLSAGGEYGSVKFIKKDGELPFSGGSTGLVNVSPVAFLVDDGKNVKAVRIGNAVLDYLLGSLEGFIDKIKEKKDV